MPSLDLLLAPFAVAFRREVFDLFRQLVPAWIVCLGRRTVSRVWETTGQARQRNHAAAYRLFSQAEAIGPLCWKAALWQISSGDRLRTPTQMLADEKRWPAATQWLTFPNGQRRARQQLGFHDPQVWPAEAVACATPMAWLVGALVVLWYTESGKDGPQAHRQQPWYRHKRSLTFADMLARCRLQLWQHWLQQGGVAGVGPEGRWSWLLEYIATAA
jgi:hypothetical protein